MDVKVTMTGPLLDGMAPKEIDAFMAEATETVAQEGLDMVRRELRSVLRDPTGHYESKVQTNQVRDDFVVNDSGVVYGPWLEGVSSRNRSTRFKGYSTFRRTAQRLQDRAVEIAERVLPEYLRRLNG